MKNALIIIVLMLSWKNPGWAQSSTSSKFKFGISFSPYSCYRQLNYQDVNRWLSGILNHEEISKFGFSAGLAIQYRISRKMNIESGIQYSDQGEKTIKMPLSWVTVNQSYPISSYTVFHYQFVGIPLIVDYSIPGNKITYFFSAGFSGSIFLNKRTTVISTYEDGHNTMSSSNKDIGYAKFNLAAVIGFGASYDLSKRLTFQLQPVFLRSLNSIIIDKNAKIYLFSFGANFRLMYSFK
jgi:hypothetical protein